MSERAPYSRVYWSINRDAKFVGIYSDDAALALWLRLLMTADALWPASAPLPRSSRRKPLDALVTAGLVDLEPDDFYRIHGLDDERGRRAAAAKRDPVATRPGPKRDPVGSLDETRRDETSTRRDDAREGDDGREDLEAFVLVKRRAPTEGQRHLLDRVMATHDETGPSWAASIILSNPADPIGAVIEADKAWRSDRIEAAKVAEKPRPQRRTMGLPKEVQELANHLAMIDRERNGAA